MRKRYEDRLLYCTECREQPDHFYEVMAWEINRVNSDGSFIEQKDGEVMEYQCPECLTTASWGWDLNREP